MFRCFIANLPSRMHSLMIDGSASSSDLLHKIMTKLNRLGFPVPEKGRLRFFTTLMIFFLIAFIYDILRTVKIAMVISSQNSGAEIIPFIKIWGILPGTLLFTLLFTVLVRRLGIEKVFYVMVSIFLLFFLFFITFIYPNRDSLEFQSGGQYLQSLLPPGAKGFVAMVRYWHYTLFYLFAELWGNIILNMLFWGFINEVTVFSDAKRFYSVFALSANIAPVVAGRFCLSYKGTNWEDSLRFFLISVMIAGFVLLVLFYALNRILGKNRIADPTSCPPHDNEEMKGFSLLECIQFVRKSRYLRYVLIIVFGYYMVYNLADILWTDQVGIKFKGDTAALNEYLNKVSTVKGVIATLLALVISGKVIQNFGWYSAALITPALLAITSLLFFLCIFFDQGFLGDVVISLFTSPFIHIVVLIGAVQHCLVRASKYTVFDATKEMAFIPLDRQSQRMGKAVIDGIGARIGKSGGSFVFQFLLYFLGSLSATVPYIAVLTGVILVAWFFAIGQLHKEIEAKIQEQEAGEKI